MTNRRNTTNATIEARAISALKPYARNARTHSKKQVKQIAASIERFGFTNPVLVSDAGEIIAGHGRVEAAKLLGMKSVPTLALSHLSETERRAYVLADNKLALNAGWDREILAIELQGLIDLDFDVELTGFSLAEVDFALDAASDADPDGSETPEDAVPEVTGPAVTRMGDVLELGRHRLICGDARSASDMALLMQNAQADMVFTDPPYNVAIDGHVSGLGEVKHREFAMASGEMSRSQFTTFLTDSLGNVASVMRDGAIAFVCMDWRHMGELLDAGEAVFTELKNLIVWNKTNGGMGAFYRSNRYDEYGVTPTSNFGRFQYTGQMWIPQLGLYYYKARFYNPTLGRFMQTDPIGYNDQINLYAYVGNDPVNATDPSGSEGYRSEWHGAESMRDQGERDGQFARDAVGAVVDFVENYIGMREANTIGADTYYHCQANCQASARSETGERVAEDISDLRETTDQARGDPASASVRDQRANHLGRDGGRNARQSRPNRRVDSRWQRERICRAVCDSYRPRPRATTPERGRIPPRPPEPPTPVRPRRQR